jgi:hypothetical protein
MTNIMPEGEALRKAVKWISEKRKENPEIDISRMVNEAGMRFDLSPKDQEFLFRFCKEEKYQGLP